MNGTVADRSDGDILAIKGSDRYKTVDELVKKSQPNSVYYTLLLLSALIITAGILVNNAAIVIGGMLVAPVLTPVLLISLGITSGELMSIKNALYLVAKSSGIIILSGVVLAFLFKGSDQLSFVVDDSVRTAALYFLVALAAGAAGTFAWARKDVIDIMPGVVIAVSLVPPLSLIGIGISTFDFGLARFNFLIFVFNLLGILAGSLVVFSLLQFYKTKNQVREKVMEAEQSHNHHKEPETL